MRHAASLRSLSKVDVTDKSKAAPQNKVPAAVATKKQDHHLVKAGLEVHVSKEEEEKDREMNSELVMKSSSLLNKTPQSRIQTLHSPFMQNIYRIYNQKGSSVQASQTVYSKQPGNYLQTKEHLNTKPNDDNESALNMLEVEGYDGERRSVLQDSRANELSSCNLFEGRELDDFNHDNKNIACITTPSNHKTVKSQLKSSLRNSSTCNVRVNPNTKDKDKNIPQMQKHKHEKSEVNPISRTHAGPSSKSINLIFGKEADLNRAKHSLEPQGAKNGSKNTNHLQQEKKSMKEPTNDAMMSKNLEDRVDNQEFRLMTPGNNQGNLQLTRITPNSTPATNIVPKTSTKVTEFKAINSSYLTTQLLSQEAKYEQKKKGNPNQKMTASKTVHANQNLAKLARSKSHQDLEANDASMKEESAKLRRESTLTMDKESGSLLTARTEKKPRVKPMEVTKLLKESKTGEFNLELTNLKQKFIAGNRGSHR